jgi:murein DD-endopeptidase MepM/ murein hydrolase activator NlpD
MTILCASVLIIHAQDDDPRPAAARTFTAQGITVELYSESIQQGHVGLVRVSGVGLTSVEASVFERTIPFFQTTLDDDRGFYGFVPVTFEQSIRTYDMTLNVTVNDSLQRALLVPLDVSSGGFLRQDVELREDQLDLINPEVEVREFAQLDMLSANVTDAWYGVSGFEPAADGELTSPYGALRVFNGELETRHTGWDYNGGQGDLLRAMGDGRVVFSGNMDIRGGYVLLDHGQGVYSGYAHLSVKHVAVGQFIRRGQVIGLAGSTGRSSSPHLHIEMRVHNIWVDPVDFVSMWTP